MQRSNDIDWRSSRPRRHIARWVVGLGGVVAVLAYLNGGMPSEPDIRLRVLNPAPQPPPRIQADARLSPRARADYQALRRELLSAD
jgi:multidrug efflux pump subunit AcrA (membrane-fusion protein)